MSTPSLAPPAGPAIQSDNVPSPPSSRINIVRSSQILFLHLAPLAVIWVGWSPVAVGAALGLYVLRMFAVTAFYHRYFSHRAFRTSRPAQFVFAVLGNSSSQRGPLWWAGHHRYHHRHADGERDLHSPRRRGFFMSHMGWLLTEDSVPTLDRLVSDLARYPELRFLDRFYMIVPGALAGGLFAVGALLERTAPGLGTNGPQLMVWGFFVSTLWLLHGTYTVNSLSHRFGTRRFETRDDSRNNWWLAGITLGESWHNNHHRFPSSVRQGLRWWEIDCTWYALLVLDRLGVIWDLKLPPPEARAEPAP